MHNSFLSEEDDDDSAGGAMPLDGPAEGEPEPAEDESADGEPLEKQDPLCDPRRSLAEDTAIGWTYDDNILIRVCPSILSLTRPARIWNVLFKPSWTVLLLPC